MTDKVPKMPHVLHVIPGLMAGGMELTMAKVIRGLSNGLIKHSIAYMKGEPEIADQLPGETELHFLDARPNELRLPARLARVIDQVQPTVIHARNWGAWPDTVAARLLSRRKPPSVLSFHGLGRAGYMPRRRRYASWLLARMSTRLVTVSGESKQLMAAKWGWPEQRVEVIPNGVDTELFSPSEPREDGQRLVVGSVGNLRPVKNHALLVNACAELVKSGVDLELRIAGEGEERENLTALASRSGLKERLKLAGSLDDVPSFLRSLDLFVLSSDSEQHPNALNEAMACGLPCVSTRVGCAHELFDEGRCGRIVEKGDCHQMTETIGELLADRGSRRRFADAARQQACENYSLNKMLSAYERLYRGCSDGESSES
jgi:glycosyltransferase involved in cell wall biosynthesis